MKKYIFIISILFSIQATSKPCQVELSSIIVRNSKLSPSLIKLETDCPPLQTEKLKEFICQNTGKFEIKQLTRYLGENAPQINTNTGHVQILSINEFLNKTYKLESNKEFISSSLIGANKALFLSDINSAQVHCDSCGRLTGETNVSIKLQDKNTSQNIWVKSTVAFEVEAFFPTNLIYPSIKKLNEKSFVRKKTFSQNPARLFTDINDIRFFKLRKTLEPNRPLSKQDFIAHNLVKAGRQTKVMFKSSTVALTLMATALEFGKAGDSIRLRNPNSNKVLTAKVIDFDTVLVEL